MATTNEIVSALYNAFSINPFAQAMWQGGAAAFNRTDQWSDIDIMLIVDDGYEQQAMALVQTVLEKEFGIDNLFAIDPPHWPGMLQTFFRLKNTSPFLLIDFSVLPVSAADKFAEPEIHGNAVVLFDKKNILTSVTPVDVAQLKAKLLHRIAMHRHKQDIFWVMVDKELNRNNAIDAFVFYWSFTLSPLVEMLRIKYSPFHWNFGSRYLAKHLPKDIADKLQLLYYVKDIEDLKAKNVEARAWLVTAVDEAEQSLT